MNNKLMLKVYDVDYSFIIKNYLDQKLWDKEWTIFVYKYWKATIRLYYIDVKDKKIHFEVKVTDGTPDIDYWNDSCTRSLSYKFEIDRIDILKNAINDEVMKCISYLEDIRYICQTKQYKELTSKIYEEEEILEDIANEFLDDNNVNNSDIREAYINWYKEKMCKAERLRDDYEESQKYILITDVYYVFAEAIKSEKWKEIINSHLTSNQLQFVLKEIEEYKEYMESDEFNENAKSELEDL